MFNKNLKEYFVFKSVVLAACLTISFSCKTLAAELVVPGDPAEPVDGETIGSGQTYDQMTINDQGEASNTSVEDGGTVTVNDGGIATDTTVENGGAITVNEGGIASNITANEGATVTINGGTAANAVISGGVVDVNSGTAGNFVITNDGKISAKDENAVVENLNIDGGNFSFSTNASVSGIINGVNVNISGNTATDFYINQGSDLTVEDAGLASSTTVSGGTFVVTGTDSSASDTTVSDSGTMTISDQATADNVSIFNQGNVSVDNASLDSVIVEDAGKLTTIGTSTISDLTAQKGSLINIGDDTTIKGSLTVDAEADLSSSTFDKNLQAWCSV